MGWGGSKDKFTGPVSAIQIVKGIKTRGIKVQKESRRMNFLEKKSKEGKFGDVKGVGVGE